MTAIFDVRDARRSHSGDEMRITVRTATEEGSGTDANVRCTLYDARSGASETHALDAQWEDDFRRGSVHAYTVVTRLFSDAAADASDVATKPVAICLHVDARGYAPEWRVRDVTVSRAHKWRVQFAVDGWVLPHAPRVAYAPALARLPLEQWPQPLRVLRCNEIDGRRAQMPWAHWPIGLPGSHAAPSPERLPMDLRFLDGKSRDFNRAILVGVKDLALSMLLRAHTPWDALDDYRALLHCNEQRTHETRYVAEHWRDDAEFGRQYLQGVAPTHLRAVGVAEVRADGGGDSGGALWERLFYVNDAANRQRLAACLPHGQSLERAARDGRLYVLDYAMLDGLPLNDQHGAEQWYCPPARCLLYARRHTAALVPVAVQLECCHEAPVWTARHDTPDDWLLAKTYVKCATANVHQIITHALQTHLVTECFAMAAERTLSHAHPINVLLRPHTRYTIAINTRARESLVGAGGLFDQFIAIGGREQAHLQLAGRVLREQWSLLECNDVEALLARRGLLSAAALPDYCYRDDALLLWHALRQYVADVVGVAYARGGQAQLDADDEMQAWIGELRRYAFRLDGRERRDRVFGDGDGDGDGAVTLATLQRVLTAVLFTCSAQHAAVNFCQFAQYGFVPNLPAHMRLPPPRARNAARPLVDALPERLNTARQVALSYVLSRYEDDEVYLLDARFNEPLRRMGASYARAFDRFQERLRDVERTVEARNDALEARGKPRYTYLLPSRVPCSIAI